jgi:hypothetical protein
VWPSVAIAVALVNVGLLLTAVDGRRPPAGAGGLRGTVRAIEQSPERSVHRTVVLTTSSIARRRRPQRARRRRPVAAERAR